MRRIKIKSPSQQETGYMSRTMSKSLLSSSPIQSWTNFYHKPYASDWKEAREKAYERVTTAALHEGI